MSVPEAQCGLLASFCAADAILSSEHSVAKTWLPLTMDTPGTDEPIRSELVLSSTKTIVSELDDSFCCRKSVNEKATVLREETCTSALGTHNGE